MKKKELTPFYKFSKVLSLCLILLLNGGCMLTYLAKSSYSQMRILYNRENIDEVLQNKQLPELTKEKLLFVKKVRDFCFEDLKLKKTKNYSSYVQLEGNYVSYLLRVSPKYELKSYEWSFPIVGKFPYLGFFDKKDALKEQNKFIKKDYDTYVRGVTAFSTLGWFNDPILSSMLNYSQHDLANLIIHETVHSTLFIKNHTDFNERMATFLANVGTEIFYKKIEGNQSSTLTKIKDEIEDDRVFSKFIGTELEELKSWYKITEDLNEGLKQKRLKAIQIKFLEKIKPNLKTKKYFSFDRKKLNNANLLPYFTYLADLTDFEKLHHQLGSNFEKTLKFLKSLEKSKDPSQELKKSLL